MMYDGSWQAWNVFAGTEQEPHPWVFDRTPMMISLYGLWVRKSKLMKSVPQPKRESIDESGLFVLSTHWPLALRVPLIPPPPRKLQERNVRPKILNSTSPHTPKLECACPQASVPFTAGGTCVVPHAP